MKFKIIVYVLFSILLVKSIYAIGISPGNIELNFVPNLSTTIEYSIVNTMPFEIGVEVSFGGPLSEYMNISQMYIESLKPNEVKKITLTINLPESVQEPGMHRHVLSVVEQRRVEKAAGMVARGGVIDYIDIWVLYPEKYPKAELTAYDASINDTAEVKVRLWNYGKPAISLVTGNAEIMNLDGKVVGNVALGPIYNIASFEFKDMFGRWSTFDVSPGVYKARALLNADGKSLVTEEKGFRVGEVKFKLLGHTQEVYKDQINEFEVVAENNWNHGVKDVFAEVFVKEHGNITASFRTINYEFLPWEKKDMKGFFNTAGLEAGIYEMEIVIKYMEKSTIETRSVEVIEKPIPTNLILIVAINAIIVITVIIIVLVTILRKRHKGEQKKK